MFDPSLRSEQARAIFLARGAAPSQAATIAETLIAADFMRTGSRGLNIFPPYERLTRIGAVHYPADINVIRDCADEGREVRALRKGHPPAARARAVFLLEDTETIH